MEPDRKEIFDYFSNDFQRLKNAKDELARLAASYHGSEAEAAFRLSCNEKRLSQIEQKLKVLQFAFDEQKRLETRLVSSFDKYIASINEYDRDDSSPPKQPRDAKGRENSVADLEMDDGTLTNPDSPPPANAVRNALQCLEVKPLTEDEFVDVPKYMKNRATVDQINIIVAKLNSILEKKYRILAAGPKYAISREVKDDYLKYKEQETCELKGHRTCTETELRESLSPRDVYNLKLAVPILRHCKRIKDMRVGKITYLAVLPH